MKYFVQSNRLKMKTQSNLVFFLQEVDIILIISPQNNH